MFERPLITVTVFALLSALGCESATRAADAGANDPDATPDATARPDAGPPLPNAVDVLFVIDNSGSMQEEQNSLANNFFGFVNALEAAAGERPSLHLGVISTDFGAGPFGIQSCSGSGDDGVLQGAPNGACTPPDGSFIIDEIDGADRVINYPEGQLSETFACIARLGTDGCGFEQPLEATRRALDGTRAQNDGFVRDGALLAIIYISDEDDCSASDPSLYDPDSASVGPLSSFRCFRQGVACEPDDDSLGPRSSCEPREDSDYMVPVSEYIDFLYSKKPPERIVVAGIIGNSAPVSVALDNQGNPGLEPSCVSASGEAAPPIRLHAVLDAFPGRNVASTICNEDLTDALLVVAGLIADNLPE